MKYSDRPTRRAIVILTGGSLLVGACGNLMGLGPGKSPQLYVLDPAMPAGGVAPAADWQLTVAVPLAPASLDTVRIALNPTPLTMDYFANASWPDRLPLLLQSLLVAAFENRIAAVARDTSGLHADYLLETEIRSFQARYETAGSPPDIVLEIDAALVRMPEGQIVARRTLSEQARAKTNAVPAIVAAFNTAMGAMLSDLVNWTVAAAPPLPPGAAPASPAKALP